MSTSDNNCQQSPQCTKDPPEVTSLQNTSTNIMLLLCKRVFMAWSTWWHVHIDLVHYMLILCVSILTNLFSVCLSSKVWVALKLHTMIKLQDYGYPIQTLSVKCQKKWKGPTGKPKARKTARKSNFRSVHTSCILCINITPYLSITKSEIWFGLKRERNFWWLVYYLLNLNNYSLLSGQLSVDSSRRNLLSVQFSLFPSLSNITSIYCPKFICQYLAICL